ncbi:S-adenosyl-L-methionine-dependent methyltransferase [Suhomyces tanzawaensis NRRL Y-17324]|uniref:S-adenosyl-L-methionine-dependent methyltransferase n=1 Tax=Suhomyces tanzawaensis NRRL Y-17324 TaxID=984487 RepID=A0A1E4SF37_9ASCO|nr:S-adenosyl-L-methionine-dependent methyltransferase [Suhomyces tanzawaensis NRRL Y-17324]ODV78139.1 S-adenosyl-L-methionine-dependent methyltransferase [Suhomyces tanzawaensis NRRL Y-17324]
MIRLGLVGLPARTGRTAVRTVLRIPRISSLRGYADSPFPINHKEAQKQRDIEKLPKWRQWALYFQSEKFKKSMTIYYICGFGATCVAFFYYMRDRYHEDKQIQHVRKKYKNDPKSLSEYEFLMLRKLSQETLRPLEEKKYRIYQMMRKEFRRKHLMDKSVMFNPTPEELEEWYSKQPRRTVKKAPVLDKPIGEKTAEEKEQEVLTNDKLTNAENPNIVPAEDTTEFYEEKAAAYDEEIKWEERGMFLGKRRKWLMKQLKGDVLEVACGTGRNIPYFYPELVNSITFLDSSRNMVDLTQKKFRSAYPDFRKVGFTVGKAEELAQLASEGKEIKYDTVVEAFGLCAHEDPVKALKNMSSLLKPGGRIVLLEHGRGTWDFVNNHLDFRSERRMKTWACRWNLDIGELIDEAGLDITYEKRVHLGTTWMLVCKRPEDPLRSEEKSFMNKLWGRDPKPIQRE